MNPTNVLPTDKCPCESGKLAAVCCHWQGRIEPRPHLPPWRKERTGISRVGCYAHKLRDCDGPISGEHFVSKVLLRRLEEDGGVHIQGFPWQGEGPKKLPITALASNILCTRHNSDLSALDTVGEKVVERIEHEFQGDDDRAWFWMLNGHDMERWLLKTLAGILLSKSGRTPTGEALASDIPDVWVNILFGVRSFPLTWGLYVVGQIGHTMRTLPKKYAFAPVSLASDVVGLRAELAGYAFTLLMHEPGLPAGAVDEHSIYRPQYLSVERAASQKTIRFHWDEVSAKPLGVRMTWQRREEQSQ